MSLIISFIGLLLFDDILRRQKGCLFGGAFSRGKRTSILMAAAELCKKISSSETKSGVTLIVPEDDHPQSPLAPVQVLYAVPSALFSVAAELAFTPSGPEVCPSPSLAPPLDCPGLDILATLKPGFPRKALQEG
jgi:hypothetical protein